jgi:ribonuclease HI
VAIYIRANLEHLKIENVPKIDNVYICGAIVKFNPYLNLNILSVYYPEGPKDDNSDWLKNIESNNTKWLILGDFNAHSTFWDNECSSNSNNRFVDNISDSNFYLLNDGSITRIPDISGHRPSAIDLSLISSDLAIKSCWKTFSESLGSDHLPVIITINDQISSNDYNEEDKIPKFLYKNADWNCFQSLMQLKNTENIEHSNIDIFYNNIVSSIIEIADKTIPRKRINNSKHKGNSWWNTDCEKAVSDKKESFKRWLKNRSEENHKDMKRYKIICNRVIAQAKQKYWADYCTKEISESKDLHKVWKKVKQLKNGCHLQSYPIKLDDKIFPSSSEKAEAFVNQFASTMLSSSLTKNRQEYRKNEEAILKNENQSTPEDNVINSRFTYQEFLDALKSFEGNNSAVGIDGMSYQLLIHLPENWKKLLFTFYQKCWLDGLFPSSWKQSVIIPVLKQGKCKSAVNSYRPIALTSHACKLYEKMILTRLTYFCEKYNIIPLVQAGFRKGRCTSDHLVKLSAHIKNQFSKRKSIIATFFDVSKAYDSVWHTKLLTKLKDIGVSGTMYDCLVNFLSERSICTRVGNTYSSFRSIDMGIPQGSIISPLLFSILLHDLPKSLDQNTHVVQYADDIAIWINSSIKKRSGKRIINHVQNLYQKELDKIVNYMYQNGMELSGEKTCLMFFNNGQKPVNLPKLEINGIQLSYESKVKFLGVYFTPKLNWKVHIDYLITKARKRLNFLKLVSAQPWSQDSKTLIHLAVSLIRSKLSYGQEVYFSAAKSLLAKLQSIDSRSIKIGLGVPIHSNTIKVYKEAGILSLSEFRKLSVAKYIVRGLSTPNSAEDGILLNAENYPKRAKNITYLQQVLNYTGDLMQSCNVNIEDIPIMPTIPIFPQWEHCPAIFDLEYTTVKKEDINLLTVEAKNHLFNKYEYHLKIFTDGSVLPSTDSGCGFVIPDLKIQKAFYLGKRFSIFTAELYAILMALEFIFYLQFSIFRIVFCVDSKSVLYALQGWSFKNRSDLLYDIKLLISHISMRGSEITFCWIPSHCNILYNDVADRLAKCGASNSIEANLISNTKLAKYEIISILEYAVRNKFFDKKSKLYSCNRHLSKLIYKLKLNAWNTKFSQNVVCVCSQQISVKHIFFECPVLLKLYAEKSLKMKNFDISSIFDSDIIVDIVKIISISPVYSLL